MSAEEETIITANGEPTATEPQEPDTDFDSAWDEDETNTHKLEEKPEHEEPENTQPPAEPEPDETETIPEPPAEPEQTAMPPVTPEPAPVPQVTQTEQPATPPPAEPVPFDEDKFIQGFDGDLKNFAEDYPEETKATIAIARKIAEQMISERMNNNSAPAMNQDAVRELVNTELNRQRQEFQEQTNFQNEVRAEVPDADEILQGKGQQDFNAWLAKQPRMIQEKAKGRCESSEAIYILKQYKQDRGLAHQKQTAKNSVYRGVGTAKAPQSHAMSEEEEFDTAWNTEDDN